MAAMYDAGGESLLGRAQIGFHQPESEFSKADQSMSNPRFFPIADPFDPALLEDLHTFFENEWWSNGRTIEEIRDIVAGSQVCVGCTDAEGRLASFARVVTDYVTFAVVLDVITRSDLRGCGLGARLMDEILTHPRLQRLRGIGLQCEEGLKGFYARWGFDDTPGRSVQMKRAFDRANGEMPADAVLVGA
jgi:GNAT superfamily N-acetyltransferase